MDHRSYLLKALELAKQRRGFCSPNPAVGAVVVKENTIIGNGYHYGPGLPHAEVNACQDLPDNLTDVALYVTLEPCCHWGKTPPCSEFILGKGIKKVYYSYQDPNPKVTGKGEWFLRQQGVDCQQILVPEIQSFYKSYEYWTATQKPWVTSKLAISLDAKIADAGGSRVSITGAAAQRYTHEWRMKSDAILTSAKTIIADDPLLNIRLGDISIVKPLYILDSKLLIPTNAKVFDTTAKITVFHSEDDKHKMVALKRRGVNCHRVTQKNDHLCLTEVINKIGADGVHDLWVEAGGKVFSAFIRQRLVQKSLIYVAPKLLGISAYPAFKEEFDSLNGAKSIDWHSKGDDVICEIDWV